MSVVIRVDTIELINENSPAAIKERIYNLSRSFNGPLTDKEVIEILKLKHSTYYLYKKQIKKGVFD